MARVTERDCGEWQGILAMHAIGLATADESRGLHEHLGSCPACRQDAAEVRSAAGALRYLEPAQVDRLGRHPGDLGEPAATVAGPREEPASQPGPGRVSAVTAQGRAMGTRRRRVVGVGTAVLAAAAAVLAVVALGGTTQPPSRTAALTGQKGVQASISLTSQSSGTRATLRESGQAPGQVLTVSMETSAGRWWIAGSYRTTAGSGPLQVQLSCAVQPAQITDVWVSDQSGHTVLNGYVG